MGPRIKGPRRRIPDRGREEKQINGRESGRGNEGAARKVRESEKDRRRRGHH